MKDYLLILILNKEIKFLTKAKNLKDSSILIFNKSLNNRPRLKLLITNRFLIKEKSQKFLTLVSPSKLTMISPTLVCIRINQTLIKPKEKETMSSWINLNCNKFILKDQSKLKIIKKTCTSLKEIQGSHHIKGNQWCTIIWGQFQQELKEGMIIVRS